MRLCNGHADLRETAQVGRSTFETQGRDAAAQGSLR
jgi:hypothetical protein